MLPLAVRRMIVAEILICRVLSWATVILAEPDIPDAEGRPDGLAPEEGGPNELGGGDGPKRLGPGDGLPDGFSDGLPDGFSDGLPDGLLGLSKLVRTSRSSGVRMGLLGVPEGF